MRFGLYGVVLAGLLGGTTAWATTDRTKTVDIRVDGESQQFNTKASDVADVLADAGITVADHDIVAPALDASVSDGGEIVVRRGHLLVLTVDGARRSVWVNALSVDEALDQLGFDESNFVSVSRSMRLHSSPVSVVVSSPKRVTFAVDGKTRSVVTPGPTVRDALSAAAISLGADDRVSVSLDADIAPGQVIRVQRVKVLSKAERVAIPFKTVSRDDPNQFRGTVTVVQSGKAGSQEVLYRLVYVDGKLTTKQQQESKVLAAATDRVVQVGTKPVAVTPVGEAQQIAAKMVAARGWDGSQFGCLVSLWGKESGWRTNASNASGAYGIPQALPGSKMASAGPDWQTNAATQIAWGLGYIQSRYGTPCAAWSHSQAANWY